MPRRRSMSRRREYMRDRASRRRNSRGQYVSERDRGFYPYPMGYGYDYAERSTMANSSRSRDKHYPEERYMEYEQPRESYRDYNYDMRYDYRRGRDYRDYADDDYDKEYHEDLMDWVKELKRDDRYNLSKEQVIEKATQMGVKFNDFDEDEYYAIYLMHVSDYPFIANEPQTYLAMAKAWLEDKDLEIDPSEKVCKYMYEIVMADED